MSRLRPSLTGASMRLNSSSSSSQVLVGVLEGSIELQLSKTAVAVASMAGASCRGGKTYAIFTTAMFTILYYVLCASCTTL